MMFILLGASYSCSGRSKGGALGLSERYQCISKRFAIFNLHRRFLFRIFFFHIGIKRIKDSNFLPDSRDINIANYSVDT